MMSRVSISKRSFGYLIIACLIYAVASTVNIFAADGNDAKAVTPTDGVIKLYNGRNLDGLTTWLSDTKHEDPRGVFTVKDGILHVSGDGYGYVRTNKKYRDYHLIIEFKWGKRTWRERKDKTRDSGLLVHCVGPDGGYGNMFMASIEAQIIEGGVGDFIVVSGVKGDDGKTIPITLSAETVKDRDGELVWKAGGEKVAIPGGRINWFGRDPDWKDELGFRGKQDLDSPLGEWTRMDVICDGAKITIIVNGTVANHGFDISPSEGQILVQAECAEIFVRRWELWPLGKAPK